MDNTRHSCRARVARSFRLVLLALVAASTVPAGAQVWQGKEQEREGVVHVFNPAEPYSAPVVVAPKELWRAGGEDDEEVLFGIVTQITSDDRGYVYVLDAQLNQVVIFSPEGEYLRAIGRDGEGPGEFRRPSDLFLTGDGNVAVMQRMPGRIVVLTPEGEPAGDMRVPQPEDGGMQMFGGGASAGEHVVLNLSRFSRKEAGFSTIVSLIAVNPAGELVATYHERRDENDFANMVFDEKKIGLGSLVWSVDRNGRVIEREYTHRKRSPEEMKRNAPVVRIRRGDRAQSPEVKASETDRDIQQIFPRDNGDLWVLSSKGAFDAPNGSIAAFDVFDSDGRFVRQITLGGKGNWARDGFHVVGERFYVVTGLRSARRAMLGTGEGTDVEEEEEQPMSLICYGLGPAAAR
jgi:hypothetical protein